MTLEELQLLLEAGLVTRTGIYGNLKDFLPDGWVISAKIKGCVCPTEGTHAFTPMLPDSALAKALGFKWNLKAQKTEVFKLTGKGKALVNNILDKCS